ncbi:hypothetical protein Hanom_Chr09g00837161 [Helianthus anomalus]
MCLIKYLKDKFRLYTSSFSMVPNPNVWSLNILTKESCRMTYMLYTYYYMDYLTS